jgi:hypothetical protein
MQNTKIMSAKERKGSVKNSMHRCGREMGDYKNNNSNIIFTKL